MRKYFALSFLILQSCIVFAQQELHIHHINVENGDATLIGIYDQPSSTYIKTILIDGGASSPAAMLLPYLKKALNSERPQLNYIALTHYHQDHYNGLLAIKDGRIRADSVIDQGGYAFNDVFPGQTGLSSNDNKPSAMKVYDGWTSALKTANAAGYLKGHAGGLFHYGNIPGTNLGNKLVLGSIDGLPVMLECVAGWGNTLGASGIVGNPSPTKENANNFTLAFIVRCGQFRYFIGGDMGGEPGGSYIDQETALSGYLASAFPKAWSWNHIREAAGHVCGFKGNHHGSDHSNEQAFMDSMRPAVAITSAGNQANWHLPHPKFLKRLSKVTPLSVWTASSNQIFSRGVYVTNLYDFSGYTSKSTAVDLFANRAGTSFSYGNAQNGLKSSYLIKVKSEGTDQKSQFQVYRVGSTGAPAVLLANFLCHSE